MNSKISFFASVQLAILQMTYSQCINRILPGCGPNILPVAETILPNQLLYPPNYITPNVLDYPYEILPNYPGQILPNYPGQLLPGPVLPSVLPPSVMAPNVMQAPVMPATIIQDSTVANNLANALQLLVVSNLLSNTLPQNDIMLPNYPPIELLSPSVGPYGLGSLGFNYLC